MHKFKPISDFAMPLQFLHASSFSKEKKEETQLKKLKKWKNQKLVLPWNSFIPFFAKLKI